MLFNVPINNSINNIPGPYESYQTNLRSQERLNKKKKPNTLQFRR